MNVSVPGALSAAPNVFSHVTAPAAAFIAANNFDRSTMVRSRDKVAAQYDALKVGLGYADIQYAVKANPAAEVIRTLVRKGSGFECASRGEIELCLSQGARPSGISFGNTIKRAADVAFAHGAGIKLFAADSEAELEKIARHAPGARVYMRLIVENAPADWGQSRKFGCAGSLLPGLLDCARDLGLVAYGLSFHVGPQTQKPAFWNPVLDQVAALWHAAHAAGHDLQLLNVGGGFPAYYGQKIEDPGRYAASVVRAIEVRFGTVPHLTVEPGRGMVADAGLTAGEAIRYQLITPHDGGETGPCVLAGPPFDSADVLNEKRPVQLPVSLRDGDNAMIRCCGPHTISYSYVGLNGFPPLDVTVF